MKIESGNRKEKKKNKKINREKEGKGCTKVN